MPERDLKQALSRLVKSVDDVVLPLPLHVPAGPRRDARSRSTGRAATIWLRPRA